jgi:hypothetical protein
MPFAGLINKPIDKSILEYTSENYNQCMKNIVKDVSEYQLSPFYYILSKITELFSSFVAIIQSIRQIISFIREQFRLFTLFVILKFLNVHISFQKLLSNFLNINGKTQAILISAAYLLNTGIYLMRSLTAIVLNGIMNIIIGIGITIQLLMATFLYIPALILTIPYLLLAVGYGLTANILSTVLQIKLGIKK